MAKLNLTPPISLQLGQDYDTDLSTPLQAVDGVQAKELDSSEVSGKPEPSTFSSSSHWVQDFKELQSSSSTSAGARVSASVPGAGGGALSVEAQAATRLFSSTSSILGKHVATVRTRIES